MQSYAASIWRRPRPDLVSRIIHIMDSAFQKSTAPDRGRIFFRADDVAVPGEQFVRMMELFSKYRTPLSLAVVPAWLTRPRWRYLSGFERMNPSRWCWHQHGWRHVNHEIEGKKQEFGESRASSAIKRDLIRGKKRLTDLMGDSFFPVFTPPWNRCSLDTLESLRELGFAGVSRSFEKKTPYFENLPDIAVNVDLHTRKERDPARGWDNLLEEFEQAAASGCCGIMIHHQMMNEPAFDFIEHLLKMAGNRKGIHIVDFRDLVKGKADADR
jgi:hypothetical protein